VLRVGCPTWAFRPWVGRWLPASTKVGHELAAYAQILSAVEGNTTFYALPVEKTVAKWLEQSPLDFRFLFKLPQTITHQKRLNSSGPELAEFMNRLEPLGERLGPVSIQLPASFGPESVDALDQFVSGLSSHWRWSVELRHPAFFEPGAARQAALDVVRRRDIDWIILDSRSFFAGPVMTREEEDAFHRKPNLPVRPVATGPHPIVRFIGQNQAEANPAFWDKWLPKMAEWLHEGREPFVFFHTPDNVEGPGLARRFHADVAALVPSLAPLPEAPEVGLFG
jgi:uncharacterized protein YecE (DUF72 family)